MSGKLFLVATPIGNYKDITLRALEVLKSVDIIVVEEFKEGSRLLKRYSIEKELQNLNEHNEPEKSVELIKILLDGKNIALISDSGTPVFSDPGKTLVRKAIKKKIKVIPIPGPSSLMPALIASGFDIDRFLFYGWLSPKTQKRREELKYLKNQNYTIVIMDTPYRLQALLQDIWLIMSKRRLCLAYNITMEDEEFFYGNAAELLKIAKEKKLKGEFVLILENL